MSKEPTKDQKSDDDHRPADHSGGLPADPGDIYVNEIDDAADDPEDPPDEESDHTPFDHSGGDSADR